MLRMSPDRQRIVDVGTPGAVQAHDLLFVEAPALGDEVLSPQESAKLLFVYASHAMEMAKDGSNSTPEEHLARKLDYIECGPSLRRRIAVRRPVWLLMLPRPA